MSYHEKEFKRCLFNPISGKNIAKEPVLRFIWENKDAGEDWGEDFDDVSRETLARYILCLYDPESPLMKEPSLEQRKTDAALTAGFKLDKEQDFLDNELYNCKNEFVVHAIAKFMQIRKSREFAGLMADEQTYWEFIRRLLEPITKGDKDADLMRALDIKTKLSEAKEQINTRLTANWKKFFSEDDDMVKSAITQNVFTAEAMAGII